MRYKMGSTLAIGVLFSSACGQPQKADSAVSGNSTAGAQSTSPPAERSAKELAKLTADTYRRATRFSCKALSTQLRDGKEDWQLRYAVGHGLNYYCDLDMRDAEGPLFELHVRSDGRIVKISESNHRGKEHEDYEVPFSEFQEKAAGWVKCRKGIDPCRFGSVITSWIGPDSRKPPFLEEAIAQGARIGVSSVDGFLCDEIQTHRVQGLDERFYLDSKTHVIRRWTMTHSGITRDRVFSEIEIVPQFPRAGGALSNGQATRERACL